MTANRLEVSFFLGDENFLELVLTVVQLCEYTETMELYTLKGWIFWCMNCISIKKIMFLQKKKYDMLVSFPLL
jgi:hypothetical protein